MKCDRALSNLSAGSLLRRWLAARHTARCPECSEQAETQRRMIETLTEASPLTDSQRRSWMNAAESEFDDVIPARPHLAILRRIAIAASILGLATLGFRLATRPVDPKTTTVVRAIDSGVVKQVTLRDLDGLQTGASSLSKELDDLLKEVDLLDARRDVEALQLQFASLGERLGP